MHSWRSEFAFTLGHHLDFGRFLPVESVLISVEFAIFDSAIAYKTLTLAAAVAAITYRAFVGSRTAGISWLFPAGLIATLPVVQQRAYQNGIGQFFGLMPLFLELLAWTVHLPVRAHDAAAPRRVVDVLIASKTTASLVSNLAILLPPFLVFAA